MSRLQASRQDGFTLIELMIAVVLMIAVMGTAFTALAQFETTSGRNTRQNDAQDRARNAISLIVKRLRNDASPTPGSPQAIDRATPTDLIFQTVDPSAPSATSQNAHNIMRVRYCLDDSVPGNGKLWRQYQTWTSPGAPDIPTATFCPDQSAGSPWNGGTRIIADHITNDYNATPRALWKFDCPSGYTTAVCSVGTDQSMLALVKRIAMTLYVDEEPGKPPAESRITTSVFFRNQNAAPSAAFTLTPAGATRHVYGNAAASSDPDADRMYYRWCYFGTTAPNTSAPWCQGGTEQIQRTMSLDFDGTSAPHGTLWFGLRVQDSGGLVSYAYHSVPLP